jgi:alanyl-tRNA synthetase
VLTSKAIRQGFIDFFSQRGHTFVPSASVVPLDDPTLLFTNAGMNQFKDIFLGISVRDYTRAANSQKCIRVSGKHNDLEEVGKDTYHHTFFEMLGNWSFGDYFKAEAIEWAWQLLTGVWGLDKNRLWATVFGGDAADNLPPDTEAEHLWPKQTDISKERVLRFGRKENFWEMGESGPCGPCSEIHMDLGPDRCDKKNDPKHICQVNGGCGRFIELWNLVFIQYNREPDGTLKPLPARHVDTGAGLERIVAVLQKKSSNYDTDLFSPIIDHVQRLSGKHYTSKLNNQTDNAFRVIADHVRTLTVAIADGALPSNDGRGYVLRRILRRACRFGLLLDMHQPFIHQLVPTVVEIMGEQYPEIAQRAQHVAHVIESEETSFGRTLERGIEIFEADVADLLKQGSKQLPGDKAFRLYDTYGFPIDLTQLMAAERNLTVDMDEFERLMDQQRSRARASQKGVVYQADVLAEKLPATDDAQKYLTTALNAKLLGFVLGEEYITSGDAPLDQRVGLVLDRTCAYAESGGQVGDCGTITAGSALFNFDDTQWIGSAVVHFGVLSAGSLRPASSVTVTIDSARDDIRRNHTATHLLQWALQSVLGLNVHQQGSLVAADHLRFDFTHSQSLTKDQIARVENLVREKVEIGFPVTFKVMPISHARQLGAMALFSEKYGDHVRVLAIGSDNTDSLEQAFSREFCGGTHVNNTREIGGFKIVREESVATGVRRITAITGRAFNQTLLQHNQYVEQLVEMLKTTPEQLVDRVAGLVEENKKFKKQMKKGASGDLKSIAAKLLDDALTIGDSKIILGEIPASPVEVIRGQIDQLRQKAKSAVIVLFQSDAPDKVSLFAAVSDDLIDRGLKAGELARHAASVVGGSGGGKDHLAQAGGKFVDKIPDALAAAKNFIDQKLT